MLSAKDFLFHALTGLTTIDPSTASGYGFYDLRLKAWDREVNAFDRLHVVRGWNSSCGGLK
jgi:xylulokinase